MLKQIWRKINCWSSYIYAGQKSPSVVEIRLTINFVLVIVFAFVLLWVGPSKAENYSKDKKYFFSIPRQQADLSLTQIAETVNITLIFPFDDAKIKTANLVTGHYTVTDGLNMLLRNTGLRSIEKGKGRFTIVTINSEERIKDMSKSNKMKATMLALSSSVITSGGALAQEAEKVANETEMEEMIVIGSGQPVTKLESTNSVSALSSTEIQDFSPRSVADIFTNIPGIQAEAVAGEANTNIKVRGLPISAGGARYVSLQEDGLPVFLIGDYGFATTESFLRFDDTVESVQSIRGGSGATAAPNSAGGVINFISNTGEEEGGTLGITAGLNYDATRIDFSHGKPLEAKGWRYHAGGYIRKGEGPREAVADLESGFQIKANATKDFENGFVRFNVRRTDESVPTYLPLASRYLGNGEYAPIGVDFGTDTYYRTGTTPSNRFNGSNTFTETTDLATGFDVDYTSFGVEGEYDIAEETTLNVKARKASIAGQFVSPFLASIGVNANGQEYGNFLYFDSKLDSLDQDAMDLSVTHDIGTVTAKAGVFKGTQDYNVNWHWNTYNILLDGNNTPSNDPALPFFNQSGVGGFGSYMDIEIANSAPYVALSGQLGENFSWDLSARRDTWDVSGLRVNRAQDAASNNIVDADGRLTFVRGNQEQNVAYKFSETSKAIGGNYAVTDDSAVFFSYAEGGSLSAPDRTTGNLTANGDIRNSGNVYNFVESTELGYKHKGAMFDFYATLFSTDTAESSNFELTTGRNIENSFASKGIELEGTIDINDAWSVRGTLLKVDAEVTKSNVVANIGNEPRKQPKTFFTLSPKYESGPVATGLNVQHFSEAFSGDDNKGTLGAYTVANYFMNYSINDNLSTSLNINNLFDEVGFTDSQESNPGVGGFARVTPISGRTASVSLRYRF